MTYARMTRLPLLALLGLVAAGCVGPLENSEFTCNAAAEGGVCASPSGVLMGSGGGTPGQLAEGGGSTGSDETVAPVQLAAGNMRATQATPAPPPVDSATIAPARVIRIWVAPHQAANGALVVSGYVYGEVENRSWNVGFAGDNDRGNGRTFQPLRNGGI